MKNNKGFTLIELIASMVILAMLMLVTVPNVVGILAQNKKNAYSEDAAKMVSSAKYIISEYKNKGILVLPTTNGECTVMTMGFLDKSEFTKAPNDGEYEFDHSYVVVERVAGDNSAVGAAGAVVKYNYYVQLVEKKNGKYTGVKVNTSTDYEKTNFDVETFLAADLKNNKYSYNWSQVGRFNNSDASTAQGMFAKTSTCGNGVISVYSKYEK